MLENSLLTMLIVGLLGGGHCVGMCGGIVGALSLSSTTSKPSLAVHLAYNVGRIVSYGVAGMVVGAVGSVAGNLLPLQHALYLLASLMLVAMGLYLLGATQALAIVERGGQSIWVRIQPFTKRFLPVQGVAQALPLGLLWGWLPCGLVYSALTTALASGSALHGAAIMVAFGVGTLPNLLLAGLLLARFRRFAQASATRLVSGLLVLGYGLIGLFNFWRG